MTLTNSEPDTATNIAVTDVLPAELTYVSDDQASYDPSGNDNVWNIASLANGSSVTFHITSTVTNAPDLHSFPTRRSSDLDQFDNDPSNNQDSATVTPRVADLALTK